MQQYQATAEQCQKIALWIRKIHCLASTICFVWSLFKNQVWDPKVDLLINC